MARHTDQRVMELVSEGITDQEQIAKILELPLYKIKKVYNMIYGKNK